MPERIEVDVARCEGHGQCEVVAPEFFEVRDDNLAYVLKDVEDERDRRLVLSAQMRCPADAIRILPSS